MASVNHQHFHASYVEHDIPLDQMVKYECIFKVKYIKWNFVFFKKLIDEI